MQCPLQECRLCNGDCCYEAAQLDSEIEATAEISALTMDISSRGTTVHQLLKFVFLFGSLNVLGAAKASAASNFVDSFQSANFLGDLGDISTGFASVRKSPFLISHLAVLLLPQAFLLIFFSELGDKTFFIAALLAARNSAAVVFAGTFGALGIMTIISVVLGRTFHYIDGILPFSFGGTDLPIDDIAAVGLLVYFGVTTLIDATSSDSQKAEDEQKEAELAVSDFSGSGAGILAAASTVISTFALVFVAEWGDKSFFSTIGEFCEQVTTYAQAWNIFLIENLMYNVYLYISCTAILKFFVLNCICIYTGTALAAASSPLGVIGGALAGHGAATLLAVAGGSLLGSFLSEKVISYIGGVLFLVFAGITLIEIITGGISKTIAHRPYAGTD
ncbi:hypothetical protein KSS87_001104 [Heliosperma pusillum]|nr:hypothetical protein KSS87_001104 [Heliosperma pusillum]